MKTILAPVDFSPASEAVVKESAALARAFDGRVVLLTVVQPPIIASEYAAMVDIEQLTAAVEKNARRQLVELEDRLKKEWANVMSVQVSGSPVAHITEQAGDSEADYIVMGSHGHTAFYDLLIGSTTHGVLKRAKCPVVIVPTAKTPHPAKVEARSSVI